MRFWQSDALTADAGGFMLGTLLPRTSGWAGIQVAWACAALVEAKRVTVRRAVTLFRLPSAIDFELSAWLRAQKRAGSSNAGLVPDDTTVVTPGEAIDQWKLLPPTVVTGIRRVKGIPGAESISVGTMKASELATPDGLLDAVERLAAGYTHSTVNAPVVPFIEVL